MYEAPKYYDPGKMHEFFVNNFGKGKPGIDLEPNNLINYFWDLTTRAWIHSATDHNTNETWTVGPTTGSAVTPGDGLDHGFRPDLSHIAAGDIIDTVILPGWPNANEPNGHADLITGYEPFIANGSLNEQRTFLYLRYYSSRWYNNSKPNVIELISDRLGAHGHDYVIRSFDFASFNTLYTSPHMTATP